MKKLSGGMIALIVIVVLLVIAVFTLVGAYNGMATLRENVDTQQSAIQTQLQRRADLIPNFVSTVKGYSEYEQKTLTAVTEARTKVGQATTATQQMAAEDELNRAISVWVNAVTEAYPDLKASEQFVALQTELAGTENRITVARNDYNKAAQSYNTAIRQFPRNLVAGLFGFDKVDYFQADSDTDNVPEVSFDW